MRVDEGYIADITVHVVGGQRLSSTTTVFRDEGWFMQFQSRRLRSPEKRYFNITRNTNSTMAQTVFFSPKLPCPKLVTFIDGDATAKTSKGLSSNSGVGRQGS